jgi:hypothetical protein
MWYINSDSSYIASLGLLPLETILYSTTLSYTKSIIFSRVIILPSSYSVREIPLGALPNIINIRKKRMAVFNTSLSIGFSLGLLPQLNSFHFLTISILY